MQATIPRVQASKVATSAPEQSNLSTNSPAAAGAASGVGANSGWIGLDRWSQANGFGTLHRISSATPLRYELRSPQGTISVAAGTQLAYWNGRGFMLGFAPQLINGEPFVNTLDVEKNLIPLLKPAPTGLLTNRIIVLDPGHGGDQTGARSVFMDRSEKEFTLDWALRLKPLLTNSGWTVILTRTNDVDISLADRVALADRVNAGLFLSLHFNSAFPGHQSGVETYCLTPSGMPSNLTRGFEEDPEASFPNNSFDSHNLRLAMRLHDAILQETQAGDRAVRRARFMTVLRGQNRPAVLIEGGFLSSREEAKLIATPAYRQRLAEAVAKALAAK